MPNSQRREEEYRYFLFPDGEGEHWRNRGHPGDKWSHSVDGSGRRGKVRASKEAWKLHAIPVSR